MITSTANQKIKQVIRWQTGARDRRQDKVFVAEGAKMAEEAPEKLLREVFVTEEFLARLRKEPDSARGRRLLAKLEAVGMETVTPEVMARMSDTRTPQGILAVLDQPAYDLEELLDQPIPLLIVLEDLQDPGNLGTILRTAEGAGATGVLLSARTADLFNPKTIRSTMGSVYRVPFAAFENTEELMGRLRRSGIRTCAAHLSGRVVYHAASYREPCALLIGNEGRGLSENAARLADCLVRIPMEGQVESLNAAVAAALLLYEAQRQRAEGAQT